MESSDSGRPRALVSAASRHQSTSEIARAIGGRLTEQGIDVDIVAPDKVDSIADYDTVILGSAVYNGHWLAPARDFAARFSGDLTGCGLWLFSSGPVGALATGKDQATWPDPAEIAWISEEARPREHRVFAGRLDPRHLSWAQRIMLMTFRGTRGDYRDWAAIRQWADDIAASLIAVR